MNPICYRDGACLGLTPPTMAMSRVASCDLVTEREVQVLQTGIIVVRAWILGYTNGTDGGYSGGVGKDDHQIAQRPELPPVRPTRRSRLWRYAPKSPLWLLFLLDLRKITLTSPFRSPTFFLDLQRT